MELGESPVWDERTRALHVVDILRGSIVRFDPRSGTSEGLAHLDALVGAIALRRDGGLIAAAGTTVVLLDEESNAHVVAATPDSDGIRFNDGACDPQGRFWAGTMALDEAPGRGTLYRYDARGLVPMVTSVTVSNGIDWSGDGTRMYYADSPTAASTSWRSTRRRLLSDRRAFVEIDTESPTGWRSTPMTTCGSRLGRLGGTATARRRARSHRRVAGGGRRAGVRR